MDEHHANDPAASASAIDPSIKTPIAVRRPSAVILFLVTCAVLLAADLLVKRFAFEHVAGEPVPLARDEGGRLAPVPRHESTVLVPRLLALHLTVNRGAVFGLGQGGRWVFVVFSVIAIGVIGAVFARSRPDARVLHVTLGAVLAGAIGNLYDRLCYGVVRDMLLLFPDVKLPFGWHWPDGSDGLYPWIFNIADVCLVVGLLVLMIILYRHDRRMTRAAKTRSHG